MQVLFTIAFRNLLQAKRRTALLSAAIGIVTALLVLLTSLTGGIREALLEEASTMFAGNVVVAGFFKPTPTQSAPLVTHSAEIRKIIEDNTDGIDYISERGFIWMPNSSVSLPESMPIRCGHTLSGPQPISSP